MDNILDRETVFSTPWFNVIAKSVSGAPPDAPYYALELDDYVTILALTEAGEVLLVRQYRPTTETYTLELPSGHVEGNERPDAAAIRELLEETGFEADGVDLLGCLVPDTGRLSNRLWCYFAANAKPSQGRPPIEEGIELVVCTQSELIQHIIDGQLDHALNLAVLLLAITRGLIPWDIP